MKESNYPVDLSYLALCTAQSATLRVGAFRAMEATAPVARGYGQPWNLGSGFRNLHVEGSRLLDDGERVFMCPASVSSRKEAAHWIEKTLPRIMANSWRKKKTRRAS